MLLGFIVPWSTVVQYYEYMETGHVGAEGRVHTRLNELCPNKLALEWDKMDTLALK